MKRKSFFLYFVLVGLIIALGFTGWQLTLAQTGGGSEPDPASAVSESFSAKDQVPSSAVMAGGNELSEANVSIESLADSRKGQVEAAIQTAGETVPSETNQVVSAVDLTDLRSSVPAQVQTEALAAAIWPTHWFGMVAAAFAPSSSTIAYSYSGVGCMHATTAGQWRAAINLVDRSTIKYIYFQYRNPDTTAQASTIWVSRYKYDGSFVDIASVSSVSGTTATGYKYILSSEITTNNVVDNANYVYSFVWSGSTTQHLCSVQLGYYPPSVLSLPAVTK